MQAIRNPKMKPQKVPLPRGKVLHLGPRKTGQVADGALEHPPLKKLIDAGELEVIGEGERVAPDHAGRNPVHASTHGQPPSTTVHKTGDR